MPHLARLESEGGDGRPPSRWPPLISASPGRLAWLWALAVVLGIANSIVYPRDIDHFASTTLYLSGASIFAGLISASVLRLQRTTLHLLSAFICLRLLASLLAVILKLVTPVAYNPIVSVVVGSLYLLAIALTLYLGYGALRPRRQRIAAIVLAIGLNAAAAALIEMDGPFWRLSSQLQAALGRKDPAADADVQPPDIDDDLLWEQQRALVASASAAFQPHMPGRSNVYAVAVAGSGTQALFSREAHEALRVAGLHFGGEGRGAALLSNGQADLLHSPLATRANIASIAQAIGEKADRKHDLLFVYLVSHGGRTAELESDLPNFRTVQPISASSTADALRRAGVERRVIVVSACFAATWIPALTDDNTIVIAAAAKDRTSFGCDDSRRFTVFGDAFLSSLAVGHISLHDAFETAKRKISAEEQRERATPSLPQAFVGRNMQTAWISAS
jgi:hypothetical protein